MTTEQTIAYAIARSYKQGGRLEEIALRVAREFTDQKIENLYAMALAVDAYEDIREE